MPHGDPWRLAVLIGTVLSGLWRSNHLAGPRSGASGVVVQPRSASGQRLLLFLAFAWPGIDFGFAG